MSSSPTTPSSTISPYLTTIHTAHVIPDSLKFLFAGIKTIVSSSLTLENYLLWKSQISKLFIANGYFGYLDGSLPQPSTHILSAAGLLAPNPDNALWLLVDHNLSAALLSTVSDSLLPHLQNLSSCHEIWNTIHNRLQSTNRSRLTQLHQQLYTISMNGQTMTQYLSTVKSQVNVITAAGAFLLPDEIIHHILNGLPPSY